MKDAQACHATRDACSTSKRTRPWNRRWARIRHHRRQPRRQHRIIPRIRTNRLAMADNNRRTRSHLSIRAVSASL